MIISVALTVVFLLVSSGFGQSSIGFMGIGGYLGYVTPEADIESTIMLGARANLGTIFTPKLGFLGEIGYWGKSYDEHLMGADWEWKWSQIYITALVKYGFGNDESQLNPYAGGGLGLVLGKWKSESSVLDPFIVGDTSGSSTDLGIHLLGGVEYPFSDVIKGYAEFRYVLNGADFWGIFGGIEYSLGN